MTQQEVIKTFMQSLGKTEVAGRAALDEAVKASSNFSSYQEVASKFLEDYNKAGNWHTFLVKYCGIILDNDDTGAIIGEDAGGALKTAKTIMPAKGSASYPEGTSFTKNGLTIYGIPAKETLTKDQQYVVQGLYSWWVKDALKLIEKSYGLSYTSEDVTNARLKLQFEDDPDSGALAYVQAGDPNGDGKNFESRILCINMAMFKNMKSSDHHGKSGDETLDRTLVHELVHGVMESNIVYFGDLPGIIKEGGTAELIHGVDDERREAIIKLVQDKDLEGMKKILYFQENKSGIDDDVYAGGYIFMRYFAKQAATDTTFDYDTYKENVTLKSGGDFGINYYNKVTMTGGTGADDIVNSGNNVSINGGRDNDEIINYSVSNVTVNGGAGNDNIINSGGETILVYGGAGADTINSESDASTIYGGASGDSIRNQGDKSYIFGDAGADTIENIISSYDTIEAINISTFKEGATSANESIIIYSDGNATVSAYTVELVGGVNSTVNGGEGSDIITNFSTGAKINGDAGADGIFNSGYKAIVYGGDGDDVIQNQAGTVTLGSSEQIFVSGAQSKIYGGDGNDSVSNESFSVKIYGGNGNDTLTNSGENSKIYGSSGQDVVSNSGEKAVISLGDDNDFGYNYAKQSKANGGAGDDYLYNLGESSTMRGGAGNDTIYNYAETSLIKGDNGNDYIYNSGSEMTIYGGNGNDTFENEGAEIKIFAGNGDDTISNSGEHLTISGGKGNDYIVNSGKHLTFNFGTGGGNDTVIGANANDTLKITSGRYSTVKSGNDLIVNVGSDSVTFKEFGDNKLVISGKKAKTSSSSSLWFTEESNFVSSDNLSAITENNLSATSLEKVSSTNFENLTNENNFVTFSEK